MRAGPVSTCEDLVPRTPFAFVVRRSHAVDRVAQQRNRLVASASDVSMFDPRCLLDGAPARLWNVNETVHQQIGCRSPFASNPVIFSSLPSPVASFFFVVVQSCTPRTTDVAAGREGGSFRSASDACVSGRSHRNDI